MKRANQMNKLILAILILSIHSLGQELEDKLATIVDPDGFTNLRAEQSIKSKIIGKLYKNDIFYLSADSCIDNWCKIYFDLDTDLINKNTKELFIRYFKPKEIFISVKGYVYKSKIKLLEEFNEIKSKNINNDTLNIQNDSLYVKITQGNFNENKNKIAKDRNGNVISINNKYVWGTDGGLPTHYINSITILKNNKNILIPKSAYSDLFEPSFNAVHVYLINNSTFYLFMENSDGAGVYDVVFIFVNGKYYKRFVYVSPYV
jgi:hypothetical protein